ncbi:MAG: glycosyltransferase family 39 protein [Fischerella sp. CENA71]|nr:glycosyltransferase family 39 protein [Fischerella sp. CENA71]
MKNIIKFWHSIEPNHKKYFSVFLFFWALFALTNNGWDSSEGRYAYLVAEQIVKHGHLGFDVQPIPGVFVEAPNGRIYAAHEIGNALFLIPTAFFNLVIENILSNFISDKKFITIIQQFIVSFQGGVYSALTATTFFGILRVGFSLQVITSFLATLCLALTTYFWTYSRELYDTVLSTTFLTLSFLFLLNYKQSNKWWHLVTSFIFLGLGFITRISMILAIVTSFFYLILITKSVTKLTRRISIGLFTLLPFVLWQFWYNNLRTGIFYVSPVQTEKYISTNSLDGNLIIGLAGLLLSPGKSIFIYAPLLILSVFLFYKFYREQKKEAMYVLVLTVLWFLLHARLRNWYGAWGWGPRHLITILPIMFIPFAVNIEYVWKNAKLKIYSIFLAGFGFIISLSSIISNWYFRLKLAEKNGMASDDFFIWSFWNSQAIDMLKAAIGNIYRIFTQSPPLEIAGTPAINSYCSSTVYVWANMMLYFGIPWYAMAFLVAPLLLIMYLSLRSILSRSIISIDVS